MSFKEDMIMKQYPRTFKEFEQAIDDGKFRMTDNADRGELAGDFGYLEFLLFLIDNDYVYEDEGCIYPEEYRRQYLWHMAKFFKLREIDGRPALVAHLQFKQLGAYVTIRPVKREVDGNTQWGYNFSYNDDNGNLFTNNEVAEGTLWETKMDKLKAQDILRKNYLSLQRTYGKAGN